MASQAHSFDRAQVGYCKARLAADREIDETRDAMLDQVDDALDAYLAVPSPSASAFADKLRALEAEYGCDWQPRHVRSLLADVAILSRGERDHASQLNSSSRS